MMQWGLRIVSSVLLLALIACTSSPLLSPKQIANADYGAYPNNKKEIVTLYLHKVLVDPYSIRDLKIGAPRRAYTLLSDLSPAGVFGYAIPVSFNAKNRMGGYMGIKQRVVFI